MSVALKKSVIVLVMLGTLASYGAMRWYQNAHYSEWLDTVAIGDSKEIVIEKMGTPDAVQTKPHWLWCNMAECESEFMYGQSIPPEWWLVGFNHEGRAVLKGRLQSP
jgi:hypothetical protein